MVIVQILHVASVIINESVIVFHFSGYSASQTRAGLNQFLLWIMFWYNGFCIFGWSALIQTSLDGNKTYVNIFFVCWPFHLCH